MTEEMTTFDSEEDFMNPNKRPQFLKVLCILSWINAGFQILFYTFYKFIFNEDLKNRLIEMLPTNAEKIEISSAFDILDKISFPFLVFYLISVAAIYLMWEMKRLGYIIYVPLHLIITFAPYFVVDFNITDVITPLIFYFGFIGMYGANLKYMKN